MKTEYKRNVDETKIERKRKENGDVWDREKFNEDEDIGKKVKIQRGKRKKE